MRLVEESLEEHFPLHVLACVHNSHCAWESQVDCGVGKDFYINAVHFMATTKYCVDCCLPGL